MPDPEDFLAAEASDRQLEKGSDPATWDPPRRCPLCDVQPKMFNGEFLCACMLPVVR